MKEQIKIRKQWLISPETQVHQTKKSKQRFRDDDVDLNKYLGKLNGAELDELEELEDEEEQRRA